MCKPIKVKYSWLSCVHLGLFCCLFVFSRWFVHWEPPFFFFFSLPLMMLIGQESNHVLTLHHFFSFAGSHRCIQCPKTATEKKKKIILLGWGGKGGCFPEVMELVGGGWGRIKSVRGTTVVQMTSMEWVLGSWFPFCQLPLFQFNPPWSAQPTPISPLSLNIATFPRALG